MKLNRFIGAYDLSQKEIKIEDVEVIKQMSGVLRLVVGDRVILSDGDKMEAESEILNINKKFVELKVIGRHENKSEAPNWVTLYCAVLKKENFEWVVQKATETGVKRIVPVITDKTIKTGLNHERLKKIAREASEQSGRAFVPEVAEIASFSDALAEAKENDSNLLFERVGRPVISKMATGGQIGIFIGPEGGWSEKEIVSAREEGVAIASLGKLTLRGETAAIITSYLAGNFDLKFDGK